MLTKFWSFKKKFIFEKICMNGLSSKIQIMIKFFKRVMEKNADLPSLLYKYALSLDMLTNLIYDH